MLVKVGPGVINFLTFIQAASEQNKWADKVTIALIVVLSIKIITPI